MNFTKRFVAVILVMSLLVSVFAITASAALEYRTGGNTVSNSYKRGKYYKNFTNLTLCDDDRTNLIAVAFSQLGYQEGDEAGAYSGTVAGSTNFTEFNYNAGEWLDTYSFAWCASFVSWSLYQSRCTDQPSYEWICRDNVGEEYIWKEYSCSAWVNQLKKYGHYKNSSANGGSYTPIYGDIIFFQNSNGPCHVGIVVYVSGGKVYTIEGNTSSASGLESNGGGVYFKNYELTSTYIHGYGVMPYKNTDNVQDIDYSGANPTSGLYMTNTLKYLYADSALSTRAKDASGAYVNVPKYTMVEVTEILNNGKALKIKYNGVDGYLSNNTNDRVVQITEIHKWDSGKITKETSCKESGVKTYTCSECGKTKTEKIAKLTTHTWDCGTVTTEPTCVDEGKIVYSCTVCGLTDEKRIALLDEHTWGEGSVTSEPTCGEDGEMTFECDHCDETKTEPVAKTGDHSWDFGTVTTQPTVESEGIITYTCSVCGATDEKPIKKLEEVETQPGEGDSSEGSEGEEPTVGGETSGDVVTPDDTTSDDTTSDDTTSDGENENQTPDNGEMGNPEDETIPGDIDGNGAVEADDYILLKRVFFGTAKDVDLSFCDIDGNGKVEADDYILLKRVYFGTAKL